MAYRLFVPADYDPTRVYPLVFFLHGAGERGSDNEAQLISAQGATVWAKPEEQSKHPAFVLAPQCPGDADSNKDGWTSLMTKGVKEPYAVRPELETAYDLLEHVIGTYSIDRNRIYCTGVSMGAFGAWALAVEHPDVFAAIVAASGGGDPARLPALAKTPVWVFHAVKDPTIPVSFAKTTVKALAGAGGSPRYTEYPADAYFYPVAHVSWVPAYANTEMRDWLFSQSRP
jgi:predicted peptidase